MSSGGATLLGSFSGATETISETGFFYGTKPGDLGTKVLSGSTSSSFSKVLSGLLNFTTYYYKAYVIEGGEYRYGDVRTFATSAPSDWLELPATTGEEDYVGTVFRSGTTRNYVFCYSYSRCAPLWTAYTLTEADVLDSPIRATWSYNEAIKPEYQVSVSSSSYPTNYSSSGFAISSDNLFARGHQIPDADRKNSTDKAQTYILSNQTPQIQNSFNGGIWSSLETAERQFVVTDSSNQSNYNSQFTTTDILYVVTGPCYQTVGGNETVYELTGRSQDVVPYKVPIPNYYWKVFLKVKKSGNQIQSACAIGFWLAHKEYKNGEKYTDSTFIKSVNQIEAWTGFNLFANLPDSIEETVEDNSSWDSFRTFE